jgi:hypothetical protein
MLGAVVPGILGATPVVPGAATEAPGAATPAKRGNSAPHFEQTLASKLFSVPHFSHFFLISTSGGLKHMSILSLKRQINHHASVFF